MRLAGGRVVGFVPTETSDIRPAQASDLASLVSEAGLVNVDVVSDDLVKAPGGSFVVVDHAAAPGTGSADAASLHRIDPAYACDEVTRAGFVLAEETSVLTNRRDPRSAAVFDDAIRGATHRFVFGFVKP